MLWSSSIQSRSPRDEAAMLVAACPSRLMGREARDGQLRWRA